MTHRTSLLYNATAVRLAVADAPTQAEALLRLGLTPVAANYRRLAGACLRADVDLPGRPSSSLLTMFATFRTREAVVAAVAGAQTRGEVCERLGYPLTEVTHELLKASCELHQLTLPPTRPKAETAADVLADDARVATALRSSSTMLEVFTALGVRVCPANRALLRASAERTGTAMPNGTGRGVRGARRQAVEARATRELAAALAGSASETVLLVKLGLADNAEERQWLRGLLAERGLEPLERGSRPRVYDDETVFQLGSGASTGMLKDRIIDGGLQAHACAMCGNGPWWQGSPLVLELDHIDGNSADHRLENLRLLCPNCHSLTDTFRGRNNRHGA